MKKLYLVMVLSMMSAALYSFCSDGQDGNAPHTAYISQVASIESLLDCNYDGVVSVATLRANGDTGLGTFDKLNGEMIVLHDTVFQVTHDGVAHVANDNTLVPFADVVKFSNPQELGTFTGGGRQELEKWLDERMDSTKACCITMTGTFPYMLVRSELPQEKPYRGFKEIMKTDERRYTYTDISGTIVAINAPVSWANITGDGWHFHFISTDRQKGGHVCDCTSAILQCQGLQIVGYNIIK